MAMIGSLLAAPLALLLAYWTPAVAHTGHSCAKQATVSLAPHIIHISVSVTLATAHSAQHLHIIHNFVSETPAAVTSALHIIHNSVSVTPATATSALHQQLVSFALLILIIHNCVQVTPAIVSQRHLLLLILTPALIQTTGISYLFLVIGLLCRVVFYI